MHIFIIHPQYIPYPFGVLYALRTLGHGKWWTKGMNGRERLFLSFLSLVLLGAIMAVMKAHLSPSQHNLIIHNGIAVALQWGWVCVLFRGRSCIYVCEGKWMFEYCESVVVWSVDVPVELNGWKWVTFDTEGACFVVFGQNCGANCLPQNRINEHRLHSEVRLSKHPFELWSHLLTLQLRGNKGKRTGQIGRQTYRETEGCV